MNKKGIVLSPKTIIYVIGGATIGYIFGQQTEFIIIGGIIGFFASFFT